MKIQVKIVYIVILAVFVSCKPKETKTEVSAGTIDATRYVSIGGMLTGGYMDDALSAEGQQNSLGFILSEQFSLIGGSGFNQAMMPASSVGCNHLGKAPLKMGYATDCLGVSSLSPVRMAMNGDMPGFMQNNCNPMMPFRNIGIPLLKSTEFDVPGYGNPSNGPGNFNPYYARMASNQNSSTVKGDIMAVNPTFFTLFTGMDEVLGYAMQGAASGTLTPVNGAAGIGFDGSMNDLLLALTGSGSKGAIANVPDVTEFPFFTTIPYDGLELDAANAQTLNDIYNPIGIYFHVGKNPFVIADPSAGAFGVRQLVSGEKILLSVPLDSVKCYKMGSVFPFRNEFILTNVELTQIRSNITAYNNVISNLANNFGLAHVDAYSFFKNIQTGMVYNGVTLNAQFVSGGAFSLDGVTLNPRGNALLANKFISAINKEYQSTIPAVDATKFRGIIFP